MSNTFQILQYWPVQIVTLQRKVNLHYRSIRKVSKRLVEQFRGVSRKVTGKRLKALTIHQQVRHLFKNKALLKPVMASNVQKIHQIDLVSMIKMPDSRGRETFKYIISG